ncbi:hypothetical protein [Saccharothrix australiensis]|uniref:Uncharacterized protein n=1 Tax=Saccharothrix australiensis TaxID=2072 RepID=A0A495VYN1_9PSEU|nr:hypothetical protein [Saccharothrix australiensis]RKT53515.1 hypothetical protein C8E97_2080 [Saccharothrix australiensis]
MSLTPIYDDLLREFEGIIEASADIEAGDIEAHDARTGDLRAHDAGAAPAETGD